MLRSVFWGSSRNLAVMAKVKTQTPRSLSASPKEEKAEDSDSLEKLCEEAMYSGLRSNEDPILDWGGSICGSIPNATVIGRTISWFCEEGIAEKAYSVYKLTNKNGICPPADSVITLISALCQNDETVKFARELLGDLSGEAKQPGIQLFSDVIRCLCNVKNVKDYKALLLDIISLYQGPALVTEVFNLILHGFSRTGNLDEAKVVLKLMKSRGFKPDLYTYTVMINGYAKEGLMNEALEILAEAKQNHEKLSHVTYHILFQGFCKIEEYDTALELLNEMERFGVKPSVDEYSTLIQAFCLKALDWKKAEILHDEMKRKGFHLDAITHRLLRALKEMDPNATITDDALSRTFVGNEFTSLRDDGQSALAELCFRTFLLIARVFPLLGRWYGPFYSVLHRLREVATFSARGLRKSFESSEAAFQLAKLLALFLVTIFFAYNTELTKFILGVEDEGDLNQKMAQKMVLEAEKESVRKILHRVSIPSVTFSEEVWKVQRNRYQL